MDEVDTRTKIEKAIESAQSANEKISIHSIAEKCGVSHSLIYNRYPDLKEKIKHLKLTQKAAQLEQTEQELIEKLREKNKSLRAQIEKSKTKSDPGIKVMLTHIQELYSMYDQMLEERNKLAKRLGGD